MDQRKLLTWASGFSYTFTVLWMVVAAVFFAVGMPIYWLFLALALIGLYDGILLASINEKLEEAPLEKKDRTKFLVYTLVSIVAPIAFVFALIAYCKKNTIDHAEVREEKIEVFEPKKKKPFFKQRSVIMLLLSLVMVLVGGFSGMMVETVGQTVTVTDFDLTKEMTATNTYDHIQNDTLHYGVTVYRPKSVTGENPAATVFVMPGFTRTKATMTQYAVELSRRGFVVITLDPNEQGRSGYVGFDEDGTSMSYTTGANGLNYLVDYVYTNTDIFDFVDRNAIGLIGHSAGGGNVVEVTEHFNNLSHDGKPVGYENSWIKSVYCSGYIKTSAANRFKNLYANAGLAYAYYDEGAYRYQDDLTAPEVIYLRFLNELNGVTNFNGYTDYQVDTAYGDLADGTYRIIHREPTNHCFEMYDGLSIQNCVEFFTLSLGVKTDVGASSQIWFLKEFATLISLVGGFIFIVALSGVLIENVKFFRLARGKRIVAGEYVADDEVVRVPEKKRSNYSKMMFWSTYILTAIIACLDYIPLAYLSIRWLPDAAGNVFTTLFPARMVNAILFWATTNGIIGLVLFFGTALIENLVKYLRAKKANEPANLDWSKFKPLRIDWKGVLVTLLLSALLFCGFYLLDQISYWLFHQDFRFLLVSASPLSWRFIVTWLEYFPVIFIFYISNSVRVNCGIGFEGWKEWKVFLIGAIGNSVGLVFILIINYVCFFTTGSPFYGAFGNPAEDVWLYINMVFALVPMMFILPIFNRLYYQQTNRAWLGPIVTSMIFVMMTLSASISFMPVA